jgi:hypothetical protein
MLHRGGHQALPANGARHALEIIKNDPPVHLVISGIAIPENARHATHPRGGMAFAADGGLAYDRPQYQPGGRAEWRACA